MGLIVQKYGGTSVANAECIGNVARRVLETVAAGNEVAVVVSAMAGETDRLAALARDLGGEQPDPREYDVLLATGEQKTIALLAMAIQRLGNAARSFSGAQIGMRTDTAHTRARISSIDTQRLRKLLDDGAVAVIAGFQGVDEDGNVTTLGRAAPILLRWRSPRRSRPTSARSTPMSTASSPAIRAWFLRRASSTASPTTK